MISAKPILLALLTVCFAAVAAADSTAVLPPGVRTLLYRHIQADVPGAYAVDSTFKTFRLEEKLDAKRITSAFKPAKEMIKEIESVDAAAASEIDFGTIELDPRVNVKVDAMALGFGLGGDIMVVAAIPFWRARVNLEGRGFVQSSSLKETAERISKNAAKAKDPDRARILAQILARLPEVSGANLQDVLVTAYGYKPVGSWSGEGIGDSLAFIHARLVNTRHYKMATRFGANLPTGRRDDPDNLVDIPFGEGVMGTHLDQINELTFFGDRLALRASGRYQYNWPSSRTFRLTTDPAFPLTTEKEAINFKAGDRWYVRAGFEVKPFEPLSLYSNYTHERIERDSIKGARQDYDYSLLMNGTDSEADTIEAGLKVSTVDWYKRGSFAMPLDLTVAFSQVVAGQNTELVSLGYAELALYF